MLNASRGIFVFYTPKDKNIRIYLYKTNKIITFAKIKISFFDKLLTMNIEIRDAKIEDAKELLAIYAPYVLNTAITYEYDVPTEEEFTLRIKNTLSKFPYLVAILDGKIVGYAYAGVLKGRRAYDCSVETSIYIDQSHHGKGIGRMMYDALEARLKAQGITNMYACIAYTEHEDEYLTNASVRFHERMGFKLCGTFHRCAVKFERSYDMVWMEKFIV